MLRESTLQKFRVSRNRLLATYLQGVIPIMSLPIPCPRQDFKSIGIFGKMQQKWVWHRGATAISFAEEGKKLCVRWNI